MTDSRIKNLSRKGGVRKKRKITITIETHQLLVIRKRNKLRAWCAACSEQSDFATLGEACALTANDAETIYQLIVNEKLHSVKAPDGLPLICLQSVVNIS
jgi:hypothetical protein